MKKKNRNFSFIVLIICFIIFLLIRSFYIKDFRVIQDGELYVSGQPTGMDYARLVYKYHIATFVNIRTHEEHRDQNWQNHEIIKTKGLGVQYIPLPIEKDQVFPDIQTQRQFLDIMNNKKNLPVLLHGYGDDSRVAMMVAVWLRCARGYTKDQTIEQVSKIIDDRPLRDSEIQFIEQLTAQLSPQ